MKTTKLFLTLILFATFFSCEIDDATSTGSQEGATTTSNFSENFGTIIFRNFLGKVIDKNENPIENVTITIGSTSTTTDSNGVFVLNNSTVNSNFAYVKAEKLGYIHGSRAVVPSHGTNVVTIMLLEENIVGTTMSGTTETISLSNGASVTLNGEYINENGETYNGAVNVIMHNLDATDENVNLQMPGMLYAENSNGEERMLQTFGMLAVELRGTNGEDLNLAEGSTAEIKIPLAESLVSSAPSSIPLWYFDETNGYWKEEGQANLVENQYIGTVSHFSFWNCDIPARAINLCVIVKDANGNPISNTPVNITSLVYGSRGGVTNEIGQVCGLVPSEEVLELSVNNPFNICGVTSMLVETIGPFDSDSSINITVNTPPEVITETINGVFNDCDGNPVNNGYMRINYGNDTVIGNLDNGNFSINLTRCISENTFSIEGIDIGNIQTSGDRFFFVVIARAWDAYIDLRMENEVLLKSCRLL